MGYHLHNTINAHFVNVSIFITTRIDDPQGLL